MVRYLIKLHTHITFTNFSFYVNFVLIHKGVVVLRKIFYLIIFASILVLNACGNNTGVDLDESGVDDGIEEIANDMSDKTSLFYYIGSQLEEGDLESYQIEDITLKLDGIENDLNKYSYGVSSDVDAKLEPLIDEWIELKFETIEKYRSYISDSDNVHIKEARDINIDANNISIEIFEILQENLIETTFEKINDTSN